MQIILTNIDDGVVLYVLRFEFSILYHLGFLRTNSFEQNRCGFVIRILGDELTAYRKIKYFLSQRLCIQLFFHLSYERFQFGDCL